MSWWKRFWSRRRDERNKPAAKRPQPPAAPQKVAQEIHPPMVAPAPLPARAARQEISTKSPATLADRIPLPPVPDEEKWVDYEVISKFKTVTDDSVILRQIGSSFPGAASDEVLFRYYLSRSVYFKEYVLPPLPASASRILALSKRFDASLGEYLSIIEADPGLAKAVLRLANSVSYAAATEFTSLSQALAHIGLKEVERLAIAQAMANRLFRIQGHEPLVVVLVQHLLAAAIGAQFVSRHLNGMESDAFLTGLFHDAGKLVILNIISDVQRKLKRVVPERMIQSAFETFHIPVGENACRSWNLPEHMINAVGQHHCVPSPENKLDCSVVLGNLIAHTIEKDQSSFSLEQEDPFLTTLGVSSDDFSMMVVLTKVKLEEFTRAL